MSEIDWIAKRVTSAAAANTLVSKVIVERIQDVLRTRLSERLLPQGELNEIAKALLAEIASTTSQAATK